MKVLNSTLWRRGANACLAIALSTSAALSLYAHGRSDDPEIALMIGEPYEAMRQRSSAAIDPALPNEIWYSVPESDARLRFIDPDYGFVTPPARFFTVNYVNGMVDGVRMSPQLEPLQLDDALKVVLDLQDQWRKSGWKHFGAKDDPPFADTPGWREQLRACKPSTAYWQAGEKYQILLNVACFQDDRHPDQERYLITLALAKPWLEP